MAGGGGGGGGGGWHLRTEERRLLHLLHHSPAARRRPLELLAAAVRLGLSHSSLLLSTLLLLSSSSSVPPLRLLRLHPSPPLPLLNSALKSLSDANDAPASLAAFRLFTSLRRRGLAADHFTFPPLLKSIADRRLASALHSLLLRLGLHSHPSVSLALLHPYAALAPVAEARKLFDEMPRSHKISVTYHLIITAYCKSRDLAAAHRLFAEMGDMRTPVSWNSLITGCVRCGRDSEAVELFGEMVERSDLRPDDATLASVLPACGRLGKLAIGRWVHEYARRTGLLASAVHVGNAVVDMYCKCGDVGSAMEVFEGMRRRNVVTWNAMISGLSLNGHGVKGIELFEQMRRNGVNPNAVTFLGVLGCCAYAGAVDVGRGLFQCMISEYGIEPAIEHYGCMVDLLGRSGLLEEAHILIRSMPMSPNASIWGALLGACRGHAGLSLAEVALKELIELEPWNSGNYVLLANLYVEIGRWEEAGNMRWLMRRMSVQKEPGQSLIESNYG